MVSSPKSSFGHLPKRQLLFKKSLWLKFILALIFLVGGSVLSIWAYQTLSTQQRTNQNLSTQVSQLEEKRSQLEEVINQKDLELELLKNEDQRLRNNQLQAEIAEIKKAYTAAVKEYERLLDLKGLGANTTALDEILAKVFTQLSRYEYVPAATTTAQLRTGITTLEQKLASQAAVAGPAAPLNNQPPGSGYQRQRVESDAGTFTVSLVAADLGSTRVIVDTASGSDCKNDCPVLSLGDYVSRNGGFAGVNGTYFCPADYPSCADKKNSFDLLVMNKNKTYFNSDNNVYSVNPAVIFNGGSIRFVSAASQWGRDTGVDGVLSNYPLLLSGGNVTFGGDGDPKKGSKGNRSFVGSKGNTVYIGVVHAATVAESARVLKALGLDSALNLDSGGSTALWSGGYKVGPGRNIPNAIIFVRK